MATVHVICNQKGGVGKTTLTVNLAATAASVLGENPDGTPRVAAVSTDPQASTIWWAERVEGLPFDFAQGHEEPRMLATLKTVPGREHIIVDTPGSIEDEKTLRAVLESADQVVVPLPPEALAFDPTTRTIEEVLKPLGLPFVVVINDWDPRDGTSDLDQTKAFVAAQGWPVAKTVVRHYKLHTRAAADGLVVTQYPKHRIGFEARADFSNLALELGIGGSPQRNRKGA